MQSREGQNMDRDIKTCLRACVCVYMLKREQELAYVLYCIFEIDSS